MWCTTQAEKNHVISDVPDRSGSDGVRQVVGFSNVLGEDACSQSVSGPVGPVRYLIETTEFLDRHHGAEYLLTADLHVITNVSKDSGLEKEGMTIKKLI